MCPPADLFYIYTYTYIQAQTNSYGLDSLSFMGSLLWNTLKGEVECWYLDKIKKIDRDEG